MGAVQVVDVDDLGAWDGPQGNDRVRLLVCLSNPVAIKVIQLLSARKKSSSSDLETFNDGPQGNDRMRLLVCLLTCNHKGYSTAQCSGESRHQTWKL